MCVTEAIPSSAGCPSVKMTAFPLSPRVNFRGESCLVAVLCAAAAAVKPVGAGTQC